MDIKCPQCGTQNWLENQNRCLACGTFLRRCADCVNYDTSNDQCRKLNEDIGSYEAHNPSLLSVSTNCVRYRFGQKV